MLNISIYRGAVLRNTRKVRKAHPSSPSPLPPGTPHLHLHPSPVRGRRGRQTGLWTTPAAGKRENASQSEPKGLTGRHGFGDTQTHKAPQKTAKPSSSVVHILPKSHRRCGGAAGRPRGASELLEGAGGPGPRQPRRPHAPGPQRAELEEGSGEIGPASPPPRSGRGRPGSPPGPCRGTRRLASRALREGRGAVPRLPSRQPGRQGRPRRGGGRRAGAVSSPFPPSPPLPHEGKGAMARLPLPLPCRDSALSSSCHYSGQDPSPQVEIPPKPSEEMKGRRGCAREKGSGKWGAKRSPLMWEKSEAGGRRG